MDVRRLSTPLLEKCHTILHKPSVYIRKTAYNAMRFIHFTPYLGSIGCVEL